MPITLSNGQRLFEAGTDSRGFALFVDSDGQLYTKQGNRIIKGGRAQGQQLQAVIGELREKGDDESADLVKNLGEQFKASIPPGEAYEVPGLDKFLPGAREESSKFFAPDFELLEEKLKLAEAIAKENKDVAIGRTEEDRGRFVEIEDRGFARTLARAQSGYAGKGTYQSGFRQEEIGEITQTRDEEKESKMKEFARFIQDQTRGFEQFLKENTLEGKISKRALEKEQEAKALTIAEAKRQEELLKTRELAVPFDELADNYSYHSLSA